LKVNKKCGEDKELPKFRAVFANLNSGASLEHARTLKIDAECAGFEQLADQGDQLSGCIHKGEVSSLLMKLGGTAWR
jgi:hypothetical protein